MAFVTSIFARRIVQAAGASIDAAAMLRSVGLEPDRAFDVNQVVGEQAYYELLERIAAQMDQGHLLPLRVGPLMRPDDYGALGLAWKSAPTVRQSLEHVARYCRLWTDNMTYELRDGKDGAWFVLHRAGYRRLGMRLSNESTISSAVSLIRQTAHAGFKPRAVYLQHPGPKTRTDHRHYFGTAVHFDAELDALEIDEETLNRPNKLADDGIQRFLLSHLDEEMRALQPEDCLETQLRRDVSRSLSGGVPRMADVARRIGVSERTLQRRLADAGLSFKEVADATRRELAENLLQDATYNLSEVAFLTGFSEQSAFNRAFKRWVGQTPSAYRTQHR